MTSSSSPSSLSSTGHQILEGGWGWGGGGGDGRQSRWHPCLTELSAAPSSAYELCLVIIMAVRISRLLLTDHHVFVVGEEAGGGGEVDGRGGGLERKSCCDDFHIPQTFCASINVVAPISINDWSSRLDRQGPRTEVLPPRLPHPHRMFESLASSSLTSLSLVWSSDSGRGGRQRREERSEERSEDGSLPRLPCPR